MDRSQLRGSVVALVTPFTAAGDVDEANLRKLIDWQIEEGTNAILVTGTTGEASTMSTEEHIRVVQIAVEQAAERCPVIAGTGSNSTREAIHLTSEAEKVGCHAVLSVGPYYNKPTQEGFFQHFKAIAQSTQLPVILYNVPGRTGSNMAASTVLRLTSLENIVGIKEASGDLGQIMEVLRNRPEGFLVLSGDDAITLPLIALGGDGVISVVANEVPGPFSRMVSSALRGDWEAARDLHYQLLPLMNINFVESNPIPVKTALALMGRIEERFRLPLVTISEGNRVKLREVLGELGLI